MFNVFFFSSWCFLPSQPWSLVGGLCSWCCSRKIIWTLEPGLWGESGYKMDTMHYIQSLFYDRSCFPGVEGSKEGDKRDGVMSPNLLSDRPRNSILRQAGLHQAPTAMFTLGILPSIHHSPTTQQWYLPVPKTWINLHHGGTCPSKVQDVTCPQRRSWTFGGKVLWKGGESLDLYMEDFDSGKCSHATSHPQGGR